MLSSDHSKSITRKGRESEKAAGQTKLWPRLAQPRKDSSWISSSSCSAPSLPLGGKRKLFQALWYTSSCSVVAYFWPWVLQKVRPSFFLSSPSCVRPRFVASQRCSHLPAPWQESCRALAEGLCSGWVQFWAMGQFCLHGCPRALPGSPQCWREESCRLQQLLHRAHGLLPQGFCLSGQKQQRKDSWLQAEEAIPPCLHFLQQKSSMDIKWKKEGLCRNPGLKQLQRALTEVWLKCGLTQP